MPDQRHYNRTTAGAHVSDGGTRLAAVWGRVSVRFARERPSVLGQHEAGQHARGPDMDSTAQVDRLVERAALDAENRVVGNALVPDAAAAVRAEGAVQAPARVGGAGPKAGRAAGEPQCLARHGDRDAEGRGRLLAALAAVADVDRQGLAGEGVADGTALAAALAGRVDVGFPHAFPPALRHVVVDPEPGSDGVVAGESDPYGELREAVRALCARFPDSYFREVGRGHGYPEAFVRALTEAGWLAALIPAEYGGAGLGVAEASVIMEEINRSGGNAGACHGQMYNMGTLLRHGSAAQKAAWLPAIARGELRLQSMGVTEPEAASDTTRIRTTAVKQGDRYVVNGQKVWISRVQHS